MTITEFITQCGSREAAAEDLYGVIDSVRRRCASCHAGKQIRYYDPNDRGTNANPTP